MDHIPAPVDGRKPRLALFPGSFNPVTIGHADIVERALQIFDRVCIAVGYNENKPNAADFDYEKNLADVNLEIAGITTVFIPCRPGLAFVSSSMVRELQHFGHDVSRFIAKKKE